MTRRVERFPGTPTGRRLPHGKASGKACSLAVWTGGGRSPMAVTLWFLSRSCGSSPARVSAQGCGPDTSRRCPRRAGAGAVPAPRSGSFRTTVGTSGRGATAAISSSTSRLVQCAARPRSVSQFSRVRCGACHPDELHPGRATSPGEPKRPPGRVSSRALEASPAPGSGDRPAGRARHSTSHVIGSLFRPPLAIGLRLFFPFPFGPFGRRGAFSRTASGGRRFGRSATPSRRS